MLDDGLSTATSIQQSALEKKLLHMYQVGAGWHSNKASHHHACFGPCSSGSLQELDSLDVEDVNETLRLLRTAHTTFLQVCHQSSGSLACLHHGTGQLALCLDILAAGLKPHTFKLGVCKADMLIMLAPAPTEWSGPSASGLFCTRGQQALDPVLDSALPVPVGVRPPVFRSVMREQR